MDHLALLSTATEAVGRFRHEGQFAIPAIVLLLEDSREVLQRERDLTKEQTDGIFHVRGVLAATLGNIPLNSTNAIAGIALLDLLKQGDNASFQSALYALRNIGPRPEIEDGAPLVMGQLRSGDSAVRQVAAYSLGRIHPAKYRVQALKELQQALTDPVPRVREAASQAIDEFDPRDSFATLPTLTAAIAAEDDPNVRAALSKTLGSVAQKEIVAVDPSNRGGAIKSLRDVESGLKP
jgi:HEAT repeat protein